VKRVFRVTRKEEIFFDLFVETTEMSCMAARKLDELINNFVDADKKIKEIEEIEHECDQSVHNILRQLNKSFITPIDREDIYEISKMLDNITDAIESTAHKFNMFNVKSMTEDAKKLSNLIIQCTEELKGVMVEMKSMKTSKTLTKKIIEVNRIENIGDEVYREAMAKLFADGMPAIDVIKWKEIYEYLENSLDACEDVANIVEGVVMKHA
jgi:uncharacterized protein